jgi:hypothetical protein
MDAGELFFFAKSDDLELVTILETVCADILAPVNYGDAQHCFHRADLVATRNVGDSTQ